MGVADWRCGIGCTIIISILLLPVRAPCFADIPAARAPIDYHTPLAGKELHTFVFGSPVHVEPRNRDNIASIVAGCNLFVDPVAGQNFLPIGALYYRHRWGDTRLRGIFSGIDNDVDFSTGSGKIELLAHFDNSNNPFPQNEILYGEEMTETSLIWGRVNGRVGVGARFAVQPLQADNFLRVQLYYQAGWLYNRPTRDTGANVVLPPDTLVHGPMLRIRYDGLWRNILELPHEGLAAGVDVTATRRDSWSDANYGGSLYSRGATRDNAKVAAYLLTAGGIPGFSEKNRAVLRLQGGFAPYGDLDRFSAFRIGGGPFPTETDDLYRPQYPGAIFNEFPAADYLLGTLQYRREILFFMYLTLAYTYASINRLTFTDPQHGNLRETGNAYSVSVDSGFLWDSELVVEASHDANLLRNGRNGWTVLILWSKEL